MLHNFLRITICQNKVIENIFMKFIDKISKFKNEYVYIKQNKI